MSNLDNSFSEAMLQALKKRIKRKSKRVFLAEIDQIKSDIAHAYSIAKPFVGKDLSRISTSNYEKICDKICTVLAIFADLTDWLHDVKSLTAKGNYKDEKTLEAKWVDTARTIADALAEVTFAYTTYEDSLGMSGDSSLSNLFLNLKGSNKKEKPYFPDSLHNAVDILLDRGEFELAEQYNLISVIEAIWDQYGYEKEDVFSALLHIPDYLESNKKFEESIAFICRWLEWLYEFYSSWRGQEYEELYIYYLQLELANKLEISNEAKQQIDNSFQKIIRLIEKDELIVEDDVLYSAIEVLTKISSSKDAIKLARIKLTLTIEEKKHVVDIDKRKLDDCLNGISKLIRLIFDLEDRNFGELKKAFQLNKSETLERRVSDLAHYRGYKEKGNRVWRFRNEKLREFIKDRSTDAVEIDIYQYRIEYVKGKERQVIFAAECKYREKTATIRDLEFFRQKIVDLYQQVKETNKQFPNKTPPKLGNLWFVSAKGFDKKVSIRRFKVEDCFIELIDVIKLNSLLKENNMREILVDY